MKKAKKLTSFLLTLVMIFSLAATALAGAAAEMETVCAVVRFDDGSDMDARREELERMPGVSVRWIYEVLFYGAAVEGTKAALAQLENRTDVMSVSVCGTWSRSAAESAPGGVSNSLDVMRAENIPYDGDGTVIAVIDSGLYIGHETVRDYGIMENPTLSKDDIEAFVQEGGTDGRYISPKIPFAYDYNGNDRSVHTADQHGTHVTALAAGYAENEDGSLKFRGVAPAAQILSMKVFPDNAALGASDADILKALEDAYLLGADVVNLSLGTEGDFMERDAVGMLYQEMILEMREAGIIVCCAAGNSGDALMKKGFAVSYPTADYTDYGTAAVPAAYKGAVSVGAVNSLLRESKGGIVVAGESFGYTKAISEYEGETLPDPDDLADRELTYVMVGGVGRKSDFAGLDLAGCVAVVMRGEIYFTEKVQNAAEAGAVACLVWNHEEGVIQPAVNGTTIPCALISRAAGEFLAEQAEDGRGTLVIKADRGMVSTGERFSMLEASSWGATSGLRLVPSLCAPGGQVLSALSGEKDLYGYLSGTSMAAPNASGGFALVMQALSERGITDKKERADLAEQLLMSTAVPVTDENGTTLSPRRQGLGVIDLSAALQSRAVIEESVLELGDELSSMIWLTFTVRNLSEEDLRFTVEPTLQTDAPGLLDGRAYNALSPIDLTKYTTILGDTSVVLGAGERKTVRLVLRAENALMKTLDEYFVNGFFLEGYVTLTEESGEMLRTAFMGYHGDWEAAPVIEQTDFRDLMNALAEGTVGTEQLPEVLGVNMWYNLVCLTGGNMGDEIQFMPGRNPAAYTASADERFAMSTVGSDAHGTAGYTFRIDLYTLRNAAHVIMVVSDSRTGEIYYVDDTENLPRAAFDDLLGRPQNTAWFTWNGTDTDGTPLAEGTTVNVEFFAWTESDTAMQKAYAMRKHDMTRPETYSWLIRGVYDDRREWSFPLTLDGTAPTVEARWDESAGEVLLTVRENQFLAWVDAQIGETTVSEVYADAQIGKIHELRIPIPEGETEIYVTAADYAYNTVGYRIDLAAIAEGDGAERCPSAYFTDVSSDAWYHAAVDFVYENRLMGEGDTRQFLPEQSAMRVTVVEALYRLAGSPQAEIRELPFTDVRGSESYLDALRWAYETGIVTGYSETLFGGLAAVSRQQLVLMLYRAAQLKGELTVYDEAVLESFADCAEVSDWARDAVIWAVGEGILSGDGAGMLSPKTVTSRAQLAQILMNILNH